MTNSEYPKTLAWTIDGLEMLLTKTSNIAFTSKVTTTPDVHHAILCARIFDLESQLSTARTEKARLEAERSTPTTRIKADIDGWRRAHLTAAAAMSDIEAAMSEHVSSSAEGARSSNVPVNREISSGKVQYQRPAQADNVAALDPASRPHATLDTSAAAPPAQEVAGMPSVDELVEMWYRAFGMTHRPPKMPETDRAGWSELRRLIISKLARARPDRVEVAKTQAHAVHGGDYWDTLPAGTREMHLKAADAALAMIPSIAPPAPSADAKALDSLALAWTRYMNDSYHDSLANAEELIESALRSAGRLEAK